jgi:hypothetical protein
VGKCNCIGTNFGSGYNFCQLLGLRFGIQSISVYDRIVSYIGTNTAKVLRLDNANTVTSVPLLQTLPI